VPRQQALPGTEMAVNEKIKSLSFFTEAPRQQVLPGAYAPRPCRPGAQHRNGRERKNQERVHT